MRSRRVTKVAQVGTDRILELEFSDGQYHLFLEFYAGGNIVLTDSQCQVIALQRVVQEGAAHEHLKVGLAYNLSERQNIGGVPQMTKPRLQDGLQKYVDRQAVGQQSINKKLKKKPGDTLRRALAASINEYPPMLLDHSLREISFNIDSHPEDILKSDELLDQLLLAMEKARKLVEDIMSMDVITGYIYGKVAVGESVRQREGAKEDSQDSTSSSMMYEDFHPFKPKHLIEDPAVRTLELEGFNRTVDEFFSSIEGQKLESRLAEKEAAALKKIEHAKQDQEHRLSGLQQVQTLNIRKAQAIEANVERVQEATAAVNGLIAQGMDWNEVEKLIQLEQRRNNPVAEIIKLPLNLKENTITLRLGEWDTEQGDEDTDEGYQSTDVEPSESDDEDSQSHQVKQKPAARDSKADPRLSVDIDLSLSPWSNAREYYDQRRSAASKEEKTLQASAKALKSTQRKVEADLKRALKQEKQVLRPVRKAFWFEKFAYFVSSDGYLVLGARDEQQSDLLLRKYLRAGDAWIHADLDGAMPCVVKNRYASSLSPVPPGTLSQAGNLCVATSTAWDSKAVMSAWWTTPEQVSKKARTGDYLPPGRFEIKGEKNFLPPAQLLLGFAVLFQISEKSKARHTKHRVVEEPVDAVSEGVKSGLATDVNRKLNLQSVDDSEYIEGNPEADQASGDSDLDPETQDLDEEDIQTYPNPLQSGTTNSDDTGEPTNLEGLEHEHSELEEMLAEDRAQGQDLQTEQLDSLNGGNEEDIGHSDMTQDEENEDEAQPAHVSKTAVFDAPEPSMRTTTAMKGPVPARGKKGRKQKKIAQKYADQDEEDRAAAMRLLGSAAGQQKKQEEAAIKEQQAKELAAQRQRRREQHQRAQERRAHEVDEGRDDDEDEDINTNVDLDTLIGRPLPGDEILEAVPICAPWSALGRYKYKAKLQPGSDKKGKAVRSILSKWGADGAVNKNVDEKAEDTERIWPRETELIKSWREAEVFGVVPVGKVRVMMSGTSGTSGSGGGKGSKQKPKKPSGRGSKKQR